MTAFDTAWDLLKIDEGMWEEIYAPLLSQTTGMGKKTSSRFATDFVPTDFAFETMRHTQNYGDENAEQHRKDWKSGKNPFGNGDIKDYYYNEILDDPTGDHGTGDQGWHQEQLMQSILEDGFDARAHEERGRADPSFHWSPEGIEMFEGHHRLHALRALGAPYVPFMGQGMTRNPSYKPLPISQNFKDNLDNEQPHSIMDYMSRGSNSLGVPPSYLYGREMVPGMGRLEPVSPSGEPIDMNAHISHGGKGKEWNFKKKPSWRVTHDE